jgi:hypothetical protein
MKGISMDRGYGKRGHGYGNIYNNYFSELNFKKIFKVLEIGVSYCNSQIFWKTYFPHADYYGIDIRDYTHKSQERIHIFQGDQAKRKSLQEFINLHGSNFDIIIDDGGHHMKQQQVSFGFLFPHLKAGGLYVCEDLFSSSDSFLFPHKEWMKVYRDNHTTSLGMFRQLEQYGITDSYHMNRNEEVYIDKNMDWCKVEVGNFSEIAFIKKR